MNVRDNVVDDDDGDAAACVLEVSRQITHVCASFVGRSTHSPWLRSTDVWTLATRFVSRCVWHFCSVFNLQQN